MSIRIVKAQRGDLPRILEIQKQAYLSEAAIYDDYTIPPLQQALEELNVEFRAKTFLKAVLGEAIVGSVRLTRIDRTCMVEKLIVDPQFQKRGIGGALLTHAESEFLDVTSFELFTGSKSVANIRLYERHGYCRFREEVVSPTLSLVHLHKLVEHGHTTATKSNRG